MNYDESEYLVKSSPSLFLRNQNLEPLLSKTPLIPISNHSQLLVAPNQLYDPSIAIFQKLFREDPVFPHPYFLNMDTQPRGKYIKWIRALGLNHEINGKGLGLFQFMFS